MKSKCGKIIIMDFWNMSKQKPLGHLYLSQPLIWLFSLKWLASNNITLSFFYAIKVIYLWQ